MRRRISYTMELSTTRYFWPRYVLASLIPEPYWLRRRVTSSASQGSGLGPSGLGVGLAAGAAGLAAEQPVQQTFGMFRRTPWRHPILLPHRAQQARPPGRLIQERLARFLRFLRALLCLSEL